MDKPLVQPIPERLVPLPPTRFPPTRDEDARDPSLGQRRCQRRWGCGEAGALGWGGGGGNSWRRAPSSLAPLTRAALVPRDGNCGLPASERARAGAAFSPLGESPGKPWCGHAARVPEPPTPISARRVPAPFLPAPARRAARPGLSPGSRCGTPWSASLPPPPREQRGAQVFPSGKVKVSRRRGSGRPGHSVAGIGALHPGPGRSSLACVAKSTYEREQGSPERGVPAAAEAVREGAASCAPGSQPLCGGGGGGGGSLPPPPLSPTRRRALLGSCFPSAGGGRAPSGPRDVEEKGGAPSPRSRSGSSPPLHSGVPAPSLGQSCEARAARSAPAEPRGSAPLP
ncbi:translation initiation factor IF-2-like [Panthera pardus]|uniref:Translation initiation factor IF-2-like n=1 Tax=Panthera pardus TaxID=9691 RepID=A0A9W2VYI1_PANPR|nr:translation initiation factor IF-2-like [Panthera pardus]